MLKVKPSKYNLVVDTNPNGTILLFNTFSTALCLLDGTKQELLKEAQYDIDEINFNDKEAINQMLSMGFLVEQEEIVQQNYPAYSDMGCASICLNSFVIDANGYFYTCWNYFGDSSKNIGHLDEPDKIGLHGDYLHWMTVPLPEKCRDCVYLPLCPGGCPDKRIKNQNQAVCSYHHLMYVENLKLAFREYTAKKSP